MIFIDIETIPEQPEEKAKARIAESIKPPSAMKVVKTISDWENGIGKYAGAKESAVEAAYLKTSFDGFRGSIISAAMIIDDNIFTLSRSQFPEERDLLAAIVLRIQHDTERKDSLSSQPYFIGHNIKFDLKFLWRRCVALDINPEFKLPFKGRHGKDYFCTMEECTEYKELLSQNNLCDILGFEKKPGGMDGSKVWQAYQDGKIDEIESYNRYDVQTVQDIYHRFNFTKAALISE